jgi:hypothetical protein
LPAISNIILCVDEAGYFDNPTLHADNTTRRPRRRLDAPESHMKYSPASGASIPTSDFIFNARAIYAAGNLSLGPRKQKKEIIKPDEPVAPDANP